MNAKNFFLFEKNTILRFKMSISIFWVMVIESEQNIDVMLELSSGISKYSWKTLWDIGIAFFGHFRKKFTRVQQ